WTARRHFVWRAGATRRNCSRARPAPAGIARRRAGGEPRPRSSRRHHAPGAPPCDARAPRRVVRIAPGRAGLWLCRPRRRHSRRQDRFRSVVRRAAARCGASALSRRGRLNFEAAGPQLVERSWTEALGLALRLVLVLALVAIVVQAAIVVRARPQDLITGA